MIMLCRKDDFEYLTPCLLVSETFSETDISKFYVMNGDWTGLYVSGAVFITNGFYSESQKKFSGNYEVFTFNTQPPQEYFDLCGDRVYNAWFIHFEDVVRG